MGWYIGVHVSRDTLQRRFLVTNGGGDPSCFVRPLDKRRPEARIAPQCGGGWTRKISRKNFFLPQNPLPPKKEGRAENHKRHHAKESGLVEVVKWIVHVPQSTKNRPVCQAPTPSSG